MDLLLLCPGGKISDIRHSQTTTLEDFLALYLDISSKLLPYHFIQRRFCSFHLALLFLPVFPVKVRTQCSNKFLESKVVRLGVGVRPRIQGADGDVTLVSLLGLLVKIK